VATACMTNLDKKQGGPLDLFSKPPGLVSLGIKLLLKNTQIRAQNL